MATRGARRGGLDGGRRRRSRGQRGARDQRQGNGLEPGRAPGRRGRAAGGSRGGRRWGLGRHGREHGMLAASIGRAWR
jgi:hypothetical protein